MDEEILEQQRNEKRSYLREEILEKNYSPEDFHDFID